MPARRPLLISNIVAAAAITVLAAAARAIADPNLDVPVIPTGAAGPPVEIDECKLLYSGNDVAGVSSGISVKFTNDSKLTADLINFKVVAGSESGMLRDVGSFAPGIEITHRFREGSGHMMFSPLLSHVALDCSVASVHFTNGSVWQASSVSASSSPPPVAATPVVHGAAAGPLALAPAYLAFSGPGEQFDRFVSIYDAAGLGVVRQSGSCAGIVKVKTVDMSRRSAALRVSPIAPGRCSITIHDAANVAVQIPVTVGASALTSLQTGQSTDANQAGR